MAIVKWPVSFWRGVQAITSACDIRILCHLQEKCHFIMYLFSNFRPFLYSQYRQGAGNLKQWDRVMTYAASDLTSTCCNLVMHIIRQLFSVVLPLMLWQFSSHVNAQKNHQTPLHLWYSVNITLHGNSGPSRPPLECLRVHVVKRAVEKEGSAGDVCVTEGSVLFVLEDRMNHL